MSKQSATSLLVLTDIHFDASLGHNAVPHERFRAALRHAAKYQPNAERIIITGDLADKGDLASYKMLKEALGEAHVPVSLLIGNHDNRDNFLAVFPDTPIDPNGFVAQSIETAEARLVLLDTLNAPPYDYPRSHAGHLCEKRLDWLDGELQEAKKPVVIFMHHPPHKVGFPGMDHIRLGKEKEFYAVVEKYSKVRLIVAGHIHRTISGAHRGIPFAVFKSTQWQMPMLRYSHNVNLSVDEPPAYGMVDIYPDSVLVHTEDFGLSDYETLLEKVKQPIKL